MLVKLDAFRSQRQKLKNWWSGDLHMVVKRVVDRIPTYLVKNDKTDKKQVLHHARLLLWLVKYDGESIRVNPGLIYGLNLQYGADFCLGEPSTVILTVVFLLTGLWQW